MSTSPMLHEREKREGVKDRRYTRLKECPLGMVLRETPYIYDAIMLQSYAEVGALSPLDVSMWARDAFSVISSEMTRLREMGDKDRQSKADARVGANALRAAR